MAVYVRKRSDLLSELGIRLGANSDARWDNDSQMTALNAAIRLWADRVMTPFILYDLPDLDLTGAVPLPDWIDSRYMHPQNYLGDPDSEGDLEPYNILDFEVEVGTNGENALRVNQRFYAPDTIRIIHWRACGPLPMGTEDPTVNNDIDNVMHVNTVSGMGDVDACGYVNIGNEWISYQGVQRGSTSIVLLNCQRGLFGTNPTTHSADAPVEWAVAYDKNGLLEQLFAQTLANCHMQYLNYASPQESSHHEFIMRFNQQLADEQIRRYVSTYNPVLRAAL